MQDLARHGRQIQTMSCRHRLVSSDGRVGCEGTRAVVLQAPVEFLDVVNAYDWYGLTGCKIGGCNQGRGMVVQVQGVQGCEYCGREGYCLPSSRARRRGRTNGRIKLREDMGVFIWNIGEGRQGKCG